MSKHEQFMLQLIAVLGLIVALLLLTAALELLWLLLVP